MLIKSQPDVKQMLDFTRSWTEGAYHLPYSMVTAILWPRKRITFPFLHFSAAHFLSFLVPDDSAWFVRDLVSVLWLLLLPTLFFFSLRAGLKTSYRTVHCSQALLEAAGNLPCKLRARWIERENQQKRKGWFLLLWWKGLSFISFCLPGEAMKWVTTKVMSEWAGERATEETKMKKKSQHHALRATWAPICDSYFLSISW